MIRHKSRCFAYFRVMARSKRGRPADLLNATFADRAVENGFEVGQHILECNP